MFPSQVFIAQGCGDSYPCGGSGHCAVFELNYLEPYLFPHPCAETPRRGMVGRKGVWFGRRTILARTNVQPHSLNVQPHSLPWPDDLGSTTGYLCFVESGWLRSFGLVWFVRGLARVGLTYVGLFGRVGTVFHFR